MSQFPLLPLTRRLSALGVGCLIVILNTGLALADNYPSRSVRLVVPFSAGGSTDIVARSIAPRLTQLWGQPVVVDNRPGGSTVIGTDIVAKSAPDGLTLFITPAPFTIVPSLMPKLPYDPQKDFEAVTLINTTPLVVVIHPGVPAKNTEQFIALAKSHPGALNFGSSGSGGSNHLAGELFNSIAGVKMVHIPYKGNAPALTDLVGGHLDVVFNGLTSAIPLIRGGKLRAIGVTSLERASAMPDVATLNEQGLKGFLAVAWNGIMAPAHTPKDIVNKINDDVRKVVRVPEMLERLKADGSDASTLGVEAYQKFLKDETIKWRKVIQQAGLKTLQ